MTRAFPVDWKSSQLSPAVEADVERDILEYLGKAGYWARQTHSGKRKPVGKDMLDIFFGKGIVWGAIEVKRATEKPTAGQGKEIERIRAAGGRAFVARCVEDVIWREEKDR